MSDDLKLPQVGELTLPQWQDWLLRYNSVLSDRESRIEKLEAALRKLGQPITLSDPDWVYRYPNFTPQDAIDMHSLLLNRINIAKNAPMTEADFEEARNHNLGVKALEEKDD